MYKEISNKHKPSDPSLNSGASKLSCWENKANIHVQTISLVRNELSLWSLASFYVYVYQLLRKWQTLVYRILYFIFCFFLTLRSFRVFFLSYLFLVEFCFSCGCHCLWQLVLLFLFERLKIWVKFSNKI